MIPMPNLDDELFYDINVNAKNMISQIYPVWTDYNKHDAGITFIELFSWFKEMQQYYLNQMSDGMREKYLMLLGMKPKAKSCASIVVECKAVSDEDIILSSDTKISVDNICFETVKKEVILNNEIENIVLSNETVKKFSSEPDRLIANQMMYILPFGEDCVAGDSFEVTFKNKIPFDKEFNLYFSVYNNYPVKRNPIIDSNSFIPLAYMEVKCLTIDGWKPMEIIDDETYCFLQSGNIRLKIPADTPELVFRNGYKINFSLTECDYEIPPAITEIKINTFKAIQKKTVAYYYDFESVDNYEIILPNSEVALFGEIDIYLKFGDKFIKYEDFHTDLCNNNQNRKISFSKLLKKNFNGVRIVVYDNNFYPDKIISKGTGFPYQEVLLEKDTVMSESFQLMIYDKFDEVFYSWHRKDNFDNSTPESRHFIFDEINGIIKFGNGEKGLSPDGDIVIIQCIETLAQNGNIKETFLKSPLYDNINFKVINTDVNGYPAETIEECLKRFTYFMGSPEKNVTFEDFEKCVYSSQGLMIKQCKAVTAKPFQSTNGVTLIVQPYSNKENVKLNKSYIKNILNNTDSRRLIGTKVNVISPHYIGIDIYAEISVKSHYTNAYDVIKNTVNNLFNSNNFSLGDIISYSSIYHIIDALECVDYVKVLDITASGVNYEISDNGDIILSENGIAYLNSSSYTISENR